MIDSVRHIIIVDSRTLHLLLCAVGCKKTHFRDFLLWLCGFDPHHNITRLTFPRTAHVWILLKPYPQEFNKGGVIMSIAATEKQRLADLAKELRLNIVDVMTYSGGAHIGGSLSIVEILIMLYFRCLNIRPQEPDWEDRDRLILSKGHAAAGLIPALAMRGYFPLEQLKTFNHFGSPFAMHPDSRKVIGCDASTGSLGHGLPMAVGLGLGARTLKKSFKTVCIMGDGECCEGSVWEAAMALAHFKLTNVITVVDRNRLMIDGGTEEVMALEPFAEKWRSFGFEVLEVNGHDLDQLADAFDRAWSAHDRPVLILANTVKGRGVDFMEGNVKWHYASADSSLAQKARESIGRQEGGI